MGTYGIMRCEKYHAKDVTGLEIEACRTLADQERSFPDSDIDWERTPDNVFLAGGEDSRSWKNRINDICHEAGVEPRKDSVVMIGGLYTASKDWMESASYDEIMSYFRDCLSFHEEHYGKVFSAVVHFDETTPHMHIESVPIVYDENNKAHLSAKIVMGARKDYVDRQDAFYDQICRSRGFERGESSSITKRRHRTKLDYEIEQNEAYIDKEEEYLDYLESSEGIEYVKNLEAENEELNVFKEVVQEQGLHVKDKNGTVLPYYDYVIDEVNRRLGQQKSQSRERT